MRAFSPIMWRPEVMIILVLIAWNTTSDTPVEKGQLVQITAVEGLMIKVKPET
jgi:membrane-bound ClpP family serine protease